MKVFRSYSSFRKALAVLCSCALAASLVVPCFAYAQGDKGTSPSTGDAGVADGAVAQAEGAKTTTVDANTPITVTFAGTGKTVEVVPGQTIPADEFPAAPTPVPFTSAGASYETEFLGWTVDRPGSSCFTSQSLKEKCVPLESIGRDTASGSGGTTAYYGGDLRSYNLVTSSTVFKRYRSGYVVNGISGYDAPSSGESFSYIGSVNLEPVFVTKANLCCIEMRSGWVPFVSGQYNEVGAFFAYIPEGDTIRSHYSGIVDSFDKAMQEYSEDCQDSHFAGFYNRLVYEGKGAVAYEDPVDLDAPVTDDIDFFPIYLYNDDSPAVETPTLTVSGDTGIKASGNLSGSNVPEGADIRVDTAAVTSGLAYDALNDAMGDVRIGDIYEITLMVNGQEVHDGFGELSISLPVGEEYDGRIIVMYHRHQDGSITKSRHVAREGYVTFVVTDLSSFAVEDTGAEARTMYRLYNPNSGEHFYTASTVERDATVAAGWNDEGIGWIAPSTSATPVYRLYSGTDHHYTMSTVERDDLVSKGWTLEGENAEGIAWYSDDAKTVPLYRQFNPNVDPSAPTGNSGSHNYTTSLDEHNSLVSIGWHDENIGWYAVAEK